MQRLAEVGRILDAIDTGFIVLTLARGDTDVFLFSAANRTANTLTGLDIAGMAGRLVDEALPGVREAGLPPVYAEVLRTRVPRLIERVLIPSGPMAGQIFRVVAVPLDLIPASADMLGLIFRNVTDEIHAEERLRFQSFLLEVVDAAVTAATPDGRVTFWNPHAEQLYDVPASEAIGRHVSEILTAEGVPSTLELLRKGERFANQVRVTTRGGRTLLVQLSARPFHGADGEVTGVVGISTDVTERVRAENALRESEGRMRALIQAIPDLVVRCSRDGVLLDVSRDLEHIHLAPGMNIRAMTASGLARESMERLLAALEASLGGGSAATAELELRSGDTTKHYEAQFVAAGADEAVAIIRDVTERRCMEMALRAAKTDLERRVRARTAELRDVNEALRAVLDASPLGIVSVDLDGQVRSWNRAAERIFGFSAEEAIGHAPPMISPTQVDELRERLEAAAATKGSQVRETVRLRKDGTEVPVRIHYATITAPDGQVQGFVTTYEDITDERRMREQAARGERQIALLHAVTDAVQRAPDVPALLRALDEPLRAMGVDAGTLTIDLGAPEGEERFTWGATAADFASSTRVPVASRKGAHGSVVFLSTRTDAFDDDVLHALELIATAIAGAVENIVLFRNMRTAIAQARELSQQITTIRNTERRHLGRELHDQLGQSLTALKLSLEAAARRSTPAADDLHAAARLVRDLLSEVRTISMNLRESMLDEGLFAALHASFERLRIATGFTVAFDPSGVDVGLPRATELTVYRIVQEALTNAARHAGVSTARVHVSVDSSQVTIRVADAGRGFDVPAALCGSTGGLAGMLERVRLSGGTITLDAAPGQGTRIDVHLPREQEHAS